MFQRSTHSGTNHLRRSLWLAAVDGERRPCPRERLNAIKEPERQIVVEFVGLTREEQEAALAAFPGGKRFLLKGH